MRNNIAILIYLTQSQFTDENISKFENYSDLSRAVLR